MSEMQTFSGEVEQLYKQHHVEQGAEADGLSAELEEAVEGGARLSRSTRKNPARAWTWSAPKRQQRV